MFEVFTMRSVSVLKLQLFTNGLIASDSGDYVNIYENLCTQELVLLSTKNYECKPQRETKRKETFT